MMRNVTIMTLFDLRFMISNRETLMWMFLMPIVFMFLIGNMTERRESSGIAGTVGVLDHDQGPVGAAILRRLEGSGFAVRMVEADTTLREFRRQLEIPVGFSAGVLRGEAQALPYRRTGDVDVTRQGYESAMLMRTVFRTMGDLLVVAANVDSDVAADVAANVDVDVDVDADVERSSFPSGTSMLGPGALSDTSGLTPGAFSDTSGRTPGSSSRADTSSDDPVLARLSHEEVGRRLAAVAEQPAAIEIDELAATFEIPTGFDQAVPGIMVMFVLLVLLTTGGVLLVTERQEGLLRRLASAPVSRSEIVASKLLARILIGVVQAAFAMLVGTVLYKVSWGPNLPGVLLLLFVYAVTIGALSVLFGSLARTRGQAVGFAVLGANVMAALGGCWWPIEVVPKAMQALSWFLPTGWTMHGLHQLMYFGEPLSATWPSFVLLIGAAIVFFWAGTRAFRFQ